MNPIQARRSRIAPNLGLLAFAAGAFAAGAFAAGAVAQEPAAIAAAGKVFETSCATCHTIPDLSSRTDRAWVDQINRTS